LYHSPLGAFSSQWLYLQKMICYKEYLLVTSIYLKLNKLCPWHGWKNVQVCLTNIKSALSSMKFDFKSTSAGLSSGYKRWGLLHWDDYSTVTSLRKNYFPEHPSLSLGPDVAVVRSSGRLGLGSAPAVFAGEGIVTTASVTTALETKALCITC
jgi:hypothetical protein